ncbi:hypothetical protein ACFB49_34010 [Sphingomonas sp. DBB INV C78]|uniref:hypothetical protein n=1 Tax=Sphingomonas sp. DBB INV C78 TaxID=3349434 RepID=UPI0036D24A52
MKDWSVERREFLATGLAGLAAVPASAEGQAQKEGETRIDIADAHAHFFNGADLPAAAFIRYVVAPVYLANAPDVLLAIIDIGVNVLKRLSITADDELRRMSPPWRDGDDVSIKDFAEGMVAAAEAQINRRGFVGELKRRPLDDVADSYYALATLIEDERARLGGLSKPAEKALSASAEQQRFEVARSIDQPTLERILAEGGDLLDTGPHWYLDRGLSPADIWAVLKWARVMAQSRSAHVRRYLETMTSDRTRTTLAVNLLIDFDQWLGERPKDGSDQERQVAFWSAYARAAAGRIRIETFAAYDPLKHVEQMLAGGPTSFEASKGWALAGPQATHRVTGFKLYPPMGFNVSANQPLPSGDAAGGARIVRDRWKQKGWDVDRLPALLDDALDTFFAFCVEHDIPLFAHARDSNMSFPGGGLNAHPQYWLDRAKRMADANPRRPVRACLGHYSPEDFGFDDAMEKILDLNAAGRARIYFDLSFDEHILKDVATAAERLKHVERICTAHKNGADYMMFGTDWIMLGQRPRHQKYVANLMAAIDGNIFWKERREKLLGGNLRTFLTRIPPG